jgi:hypothetical protein
MRTEKEIRGALEVLLWGMKEHPPQHLLSEATALAAIDSIKFALGDDSEIQTTITQFRKQQAQANN